MIEAATTRHTLSGSRHPANPWYREPWPWILMAGPALVVIAGTVTAWLAVSTSDGLVADDYYRRGLAINRELRRDQVAAERGISVSIEVRDGILRARLQIRGEAPPVLFAHLVHPTLAGEDQRLRLSLVAPGVYEAPMSAPPGPRWRVVLEGPRGEWRVVKEGL